MKDEINISIHSAAIDQREAVLLAPYAMHSASSEGRKHPEPAHPYRGPFQRDRDRIVHSAAYRRLSSKMQVFTGELGDYHRTRLTHTLEVASVARTLARALRLNEDLVEALALLHDIGHPPFGHAGEDTLDECLAEDGGFCHNRHALRIVEYLERRYPNFQGLNLSLEVLEGQQTRSNKESRSTSSSGGSLLEVQVVDAADSVAYNTHDADDALELGLLELDELLSVPLWQEAAGRVRQRWTHLDDAELRRAVLHELIDWQVSDLIDGANKWVSGLDSSQAARTCSERIAAGVELAEKKAALEKFLHQKVYQHQQVMKKRAETQSLLKEIFYGFLNKFDALPASFRARAGEIGHRRCVGDYLAGMTDRFALREYERLFAHFDRQ